MSTIDPDQLTKIEEAAKLLQDSVGTYWADPSGFAADGWGVTGATYLAMMDPATTLALIAEVKQSRATIERVRREALDLEDDDEHDAILAALTVPTPTT